MLGIALSCPDDSTWSVPEETHTGLTMRLAQLD
jgi:hypothetical protein